MDSCENGEGYRTLLEDRASGEELEDAREDVDCQRRAELDTAHCSFTPVAAVYKIKDNGRGKTAGNVVSDVTGSGITRSWDGADRVDANWSGGGVFEREVCV